MKSEEEYLLEFEAKLITRLTDGYKSINKNVIYAFSILLAFLLLEYGIIQEVTAAGNTLKLSDNKHLLILPAIIIVPYFLINNEILSIARILKALGANSRKVKSLNGQNARPFEIADLDFYSYGIAGIQLQLSKFATKNYLDKDIIDQSIIKNWIPKRRNLLRLILFSLALPFLVIRFIQRILGRISRMGLGLIFVALIYIIPLLIPFLIIIIELDNMSIEADESIVSVIVLLILVILYTIGSNIFLYSFYFTELAQKINGRLLKQSFRDSEEVYKSIVRLYLGKSEGKEEPPS